MVVRRIVPVKPRLHHLIDEPPVDALVEMRWLDAEEEKTQENCEPEDEPWDPRGFREPRFPRYQLIAQHWKIC